MKHVAIIGNGIAGVTAARYIRKLSDYKITIISAESEYFWSRTALMYIYMGHMKYHHTKPYEDHFWSKNNIDLVYDYVEQVDTDEQKLKLRKGRYIPYDNLIIASGSAPNKLGWPGQDLNGVCTMVSLQDLEAIEKATQNIRKGVIVGGGLIGIELAEMLLSRNINVTFLVREKSFWNHVLPPEESEMINRHILTHHIDLRLDTELKEIKEADGSVSSIVTKAGEEINCDFVGLTVGVHPQVDFLKNTKLQIERGILVDEFLRTNIPNIYAIGDCAQHRKPPVGRKPVEQIWYTGRIQGETVARTICGDRLRYQPGIFYNSAKFLDIEYQIYGEVPPASDTEKLSSFYWENETGDQSFRIVFNKEDHKVRGFNLMGIRYRQAVCEQWIATQTPVQEVMAELEIANFDPEFHKKYENDIKMAFNNRFPDLAITLKKKRLKILGIFR